MAKRVRCQCGGDPDCRLCGRTGFYQYQPGTWGWQPFRCPTCSGSGRIDWPGGGTRTCPTCRGAGSVDPASPPLNLLDTIRGILLGG